MFFSMDIQTLAYKEENPKISPPNEHAGEVFVTLLILLGATRCCEILGAQEVMSLAQEQVHGG